MDSVVGDAAGRESAFCGWPTICLEPVGDTSAAKSCETQRDSADKKSARDGQGADSTDPVCRLILIVRGGRCGSHDPHQMAPSAAALGQEHLLIIV